MMEQDIFQKDRDYYMPVFARYPVVLERGEGVYVYDSEGRRYLDFLAGIAVNALGHAHPRLVKAIAEQAGKLIHCSNLYYTEVQAQLIERLAKLCRLDKVFLCNSGAEANEGAFKLARKYTHRMDPEKSTILSAQHSFHGRSLATLTATAQPKYQMGFGPLPAGFDYVEYNDIPALEQKINAKTCAVLLEPVQGEGGVRIPDADYLKRVRALCDRFDALLILDEIQTGVGRTGTFLACEQAGVAPDIVTLAKGLAGGVPIGAFLASNKVAEAFTPGAHGSTFGGNPLASAAAVAVLNVLEDDGILDNVKTCGAHFLRRLTGLQQKYHNRIKEVRGKGLLIGLELHEPGRDIVETALTRGALINCTANTVLRFAPPLIVTNEQIDEVVDIVDRALAETG